ncbi:carbohydrate esterase [Cladorrhinum samala]|uniref:Carbohydrate esterase n=1 Tax=Cladorrhinum samala TaxID=585594 RepID=A0AAV9HY98_9PEZI|nr:carbohydrate esterase [Cladorrhinum samala]
MGRQQLIGAALAFLAAVQGVSARNICKPRTTPTTSTASATPTSSTIPAPREKYLITFGDSYSQTGFDVSSTKPSAGNPLGNPPLPGWTASGGLNWVGFLASQFNTSNLLTYNFAYGGATTNASLVTPYAPSVLSLIDQVAQFSGSIASKPAYAPWTAENALFGVWIGVNDVGNSWWKEEYDALVESIMDSYFGRLQVLYDAGARNFVLLSVPPIQRTPAQIAQGEWATQTEAVSIDKYNAAIATRLAAFTAKNAGVVAKIVDTAAPFNTALDNPTAYGSPDATCYNGDGKSCLWFNDYHPGIEINRLVARAVADAWKGTFF